MILSVALTKEEALKNDPTLSDLTNEEFDEALDIINAVAGIALNLALREQLEGLINFDTSISDHPTP